MMNLYLQYRPRIIAGFAAILLTILLLTGCEVKEDEGITRVAVVLDVGGIEDRGKNAMIWRGCTDTMDTLTVDIEVQEPGNLSEGIETLNKTAAENYDMIIVAATPLTQTTLELAEKYPETGFVLIDADEGGENVLAVSFPHYDAGYLMGALAGEISKNEKVGFLGGRDDIVSELLLEGFTDGVSSVNPSIAVLSAFTGAEYEAAMDTDKARETALALIERGADGIFVAAGFSTEIIIEATVEKEVWAIAYESNLNSLGGGTVVASLIRRLDMVVSESVRTTAESGFEGGVIHYSIDDEVIDCLLNEEHPLMDEKDYVAILETTKSGLINNNERR